MDNKPKDQSEPMNPEQSSEDMDMLTRTPEVQNTAPVPEKEDNAMNMMSSPSNTPPPPVFPSESEPQVNPSGSDTPPPADTPPSSSASSPPVDDGGKKNIGLMIGALLVLMVVFLALIYYFVLRQSPEPEQPDQQVPLENLMPSPTEAVTPTPELTEEAVESIDIGSPEAELAPIETDLDNL